ncbi:hypothetical protein MD484_g8298, partial [Candolleomyces efflorescens]
MPGKGKLASLKSFFRISKSRKEPKDDVGLAHLTVPHPVDANSRPSSAYLSSPTTGAAGAGKSALQQTIAECCAEKNFLGSAFFFSAVDFTRNIVAPVIPTIAYQLSRINPLLRYCIVAAIEDDPLVFSKSLRAQIESLIARPLLQFQEKSGSDLRDIPLAILIDGLDECANEDHQSELLTAIRDGFLDGSLPFRLFIASRPEWAIRNALSAGGCLSNDVAYHIQLSDKYDATADIRRFLWRRLRGIGSRSDDPRARSPFWPTPQDVEVLVRAASGQFIYAATVIRFVVERHSSPVNRLNTILNWTSGNHQRSNPFAPLDLLYANILSKAKEAYEDLNGCDFLLLLNAYRLNMDRNNDHIVQDLNHLLCSERDAHLWLLSDLRSLITTDAYPDHRASGQHLLQLRMYHKSFLDFLSDESRSKELFFPKSEVLKFVARRCLCHINSAYLEDIHWVDHAAAAWDPTHVNSRRLNHSLRILPGLLLDWLAHDPGDFPVAEFLDFVGGSNCGLEKASKWLKVMESTYSASRHPQAEWADLVILFARQLEHEDHESIPLFERYSKKWVDGDCDDDLGQDISDIGDVPENVPSSIYFPDISERATAATLGGRSLPEKDNEL